MDTIFSSSFNNVLLAQYVARQIQPCGPTSAANGNNGQTSHLTGALLTGSASSNSNNTTNTNNNTNTNNSEHSEREQVMRTYESQALESCFFLYERATSSELDTEEDIFGQKLVYFYPSTISQNSQFNLIGVIEADSTFVKEFGEEELKIISLTTTKFVFKNIDNYRLVIGSPPHIPDSIVLQNAELIIRQLTFLFGPPAAFASQCGNKEQVHEHLRQILSQLRLLSVYYNSNPGSVLRPLPYTDIPKKNAKVFLEASHLLEDMRQIDENLIGCIIYDKTILCTQIESDILRYAFNKVTLMSETNVNDEYSGFVHLGSQSFSGSSNISGSANNNTSGRVFSDGGSTYSYDDDNDSRGGFDTCTESSGGNGSSNNIAGNLIGNSTLAVLRRQTSMVYGTNDRADFIPIFLTNDQIQRLSHCVMQVLNTDGAAMASASPLYSDFTFSSATTPLDNEYATASSSNSEEQQRSRQTTTEGQFFGLFVHRLAAASLVVITDLNKLYDEKFIKRLQNQIKHPLRRIEKKLMKLRVPTSPQASSGQLSNNNMMAGTGGSGSNLMTNSTTAMLPGEIRIVSANRRGDSSSLSGSISGSGSFSVSATASTTAPLSGAIVYDQLTNIATGTPLCSDPTFLKETAYIREQFDSEPSITKLVLRGPNGSYLCGKKALGSEYYYYHSHKNTITGSSSGSNISGLLMTPALGGIAPYGASMVGSGGLSTGSSFVIGGSGNSQSGVTSFDRVEEAMRETFKRDLNINL